jgi:hypothetical protein
MKKLMINKRDKKRLDEILKQIRGVKKSLFWLQDNEHSDTVEALRVVMRQYNREQCEILNRSWKEIPSDYVKGVSAPASK